MLSTLICAHNDYHTFLTAGVVLAIKDVWFVGDQFINDTFHAFPTMYNESKLAKTRKPYLYEYYNVKHFSTNPLSMVRNILAHLVNALIKALNDNDKIPRLIIVVPDSDIICSINVFDLGTKRILEESLKWIMTNMTRAVEAKKENLTDVKHRAVTPGEPKYVWVKMLDRPNGFDRLLAAKNIFNDTPEALLATRKYHYIIDANHRMAHPHNFTLENKLNADGRIALWNEIDNQLKNFDYQ